MFWRYRKHRRPLSGLRLGHTLWSGLILASLAGVPSYAQEWRRVGTVDNSTVTTTALCNWKASGDIECPTSNPRVSSGALAVGTATPDASAALDITSTEKGFLPPRLTTAQVTAVAAPADGLIVYDSDTDTLKLRADGAWVNLATGSTTPAPDSLDFTEFKDAMTLDASTDIAVTGTNVFSVTNTGTGNSFVVNDDAGDTTPLVIDASGRVGIGTPTPSTTLHISGVNQSLRMDVGNTGDNGTYVSFNNYNGATYYPAANIGWGASASGYPFVLESLTRPIEFRPATGYNAFFSRGNVGIGTSAPAARLDVAGGTGGATVASEGLYVNNNVDTWSGLKLEHFMGPQSAQDPEQRLAFA